MRMASAKLMPASAGWRRSISNCPEVSSRRDWDYRKVGGWRGIEGGFFRHSPQNFSGLSQAIILPGVEPALGVSLLLEGELGQVRLLHAAFLQRVAMRIDVERSSVFENFSGNFGRFTE